MELKSLCLPSPKTESSSVRWGGTLNRAGLVFISLMVGSALYRNWSSAPATVDFLPLLCALLNVSGSQCFRSSSVSALNVCSSGFEHARDEHTSLPSKKKKSLPEKSRTSEWCQVLRFLRGCAVRLVSSCFAFWLLLAQMYKCVFNKSDARTLCPWPPHFSRIPCLNLLFIMRLILIHSVNSVMEFTQWLKWEEWHLWIRFPQEWQRQSSEEISGHLVYKLRSCWPRWCGFLRVWGGPSYQVPCRVRADSTPSTAPNIWLSQHWAASAVCVF